MIIRSTKVIFPFHSCFPLVPHLLYKRGTTVGRTNANKKRRGPIYTGKI